MSVPDDLQIQDTLAKAGSRSTSWLCMKFEVTGDEEFMAIRAVLDRMVAEKRIKLDTQGLWSLVPPAPVKPPAAVPSSP